MLHILVWGSKAPRSNGTASEYVILCKLLNAYVHFVGAVVLRIIKQSFPNVLIW